MERVVPDAITTSIVLLVALFGLSLALGSPLTASQIRRLRREAEDTLGPAFDQRRFHDTILALGSVPLPVLEQRLRQFIADGGR